MEVLQKKEVLGQELTIYGDVNNPLFLAKDVATWIEHSNQRMMLQSVDEDERQCVNNPYASSGQQEQWFLTENGLYEVLMLSRKPIAKQFKKEVKQILKTIRTTGGYVANTNVFVEEYFGELDADAKMFLTQTLETKRKLALENAKMRPKAEYFDALVDRKLNVNFRDTAKELGVKEKFFITWLLENNYVYRDKKGALKPIAEHSNDLFVLKEYSNEKFSGCQTLVTPKGRETFRMYLSKSIAQ